MGVGQLFDWPRLLRHGENILPVGAHWHFVVYFALFCVAVIGGGQILYRLRERKRLAEVHGVQAEPIGRRPPQTANARTGAPGEPVHCVLTEPLGDKARVVAIDIGQDSVWVRQMGYVHTPARLGGPTRYKVPPLDPDNSALLASAGRAQVTATPAAFVASKRTREPGGRTRPVLIVRVPALQPLTIGCQESIGSQWSWSPSSLRFWWRGKVPWVSAPAYEVSGEDWLTLAENFGLAPYLEDNTSAQPDPGAREWVVSSHDLKAAAEAGDDSRGIGAVIFEIVLALGALIVFAAGGVEFSEYLTGTPTTATITYCTGGRSISCEGTWSIGGVSQSGAIETFSDPSVGSTVGVRVSGGKARTPADWIPIFGGGALLLGASILSFVVTRSRIGRLVDQP